MTVKRNPNGTFADGHKGCPRKADPGLLTLMSKAMPLSKRLKIVRKAVEQAIEGDKAAREWLFNYVYGKPTDVVDLQVSGQLGVTWELVKERLQQAEEAMK